MTQEPNFANVLSMTRNPEPETNVGVFAVKPMDKWIDEAAQRPDPQPLFDSLWCEGCFCIFFAPTNVGKSALAYQIADALTTGRPIPHFDMPTTPRPVLYIDYEMSDKQIELRYRDNEMNHRQFSPLFYRAEFLPDSFTDEEIIKSIEACVEEYKTKTIIVDNITCLSNNGTEKSNEALPLMKSLLKLCRENEGLSILVLAHTPKRDNWAPLTLNDLKGSSDLANLSRDIFTMGKSRKAPNCRYIKQLKQTNVASTYGEENIIVGRLEKVGDALQFIFDEYGNERDHLKQQEMPDDLREYNIRQAKLMAASGKSQREIAIELGVAVGTINKYLNS